MIATIVLCLSRAAGEFSFNGQLFPPRPHHCIGLTPKVVAALLNEKPVATIVTGAINDPLVLYVYGNSRFVVRYRAGVAVDAFRAR